MLKTLRNTAVSILILVLIFVAAGVIYVLLTGKAAPKQVAAAKPETVVSDGAIQPHKPSPNAPESASVELVTSPVAAGSNASISIKTNAGSTCKIQITKDKLTYKDSGLTNKIADDFGTATWSWTMAKTAPIGKWLIQVDCFYAKKAAMVQSDLVVTK